MTLDGATAIDARVGAAGGVGALNPRELTEQTLVVAGIPDESRGERLVVLHTLDDNQLATLKERLNNSDLPNLWRPRPNSFYRIDAIPVLGTGKMDIRKAKEMAIALAGN